MAKKASTRIKKSRKTQSNHVSKIAIGAFLAVVIVIVVAALNFQSILLTISSSDSDEVVSNGDTVPPFPPRFDPIVEATSEAHLEIQGYSEEESDVTLYINGIPVDNTHVESDGTFSFTLSHLEEGENEIYAVAEDYSGNRSQQSDSHNLSYYTDAVKIEVTSAVNTNDGEALISGSISREASVYINDRRIIVDKDGDFSVSLPLEEGENEFEVIAIDTSGSESSQKLTVTYQK